MHRISLGDWVWNALIWTFIRACKLIPQTNHSNSFITSVTLPSWQYGLDSTDPCGMILLPYNDIRNVVFSFRFFFVLSHETWAKLGQPVIARSIIKLGFSWRFTFSRRPCLWQMVLWRDFGVLCAETVASSCTCQMLLLAYRIRIQSWPSLAVPSFRISRGGQCLGQISIDMHVPFLDSLQKLWQCTHDHHLSLICKVFCKLSVSRRGL